MTDAARERKRRILVNLLISKNCIIIQVIVLKNFKKCKGWKENFKYYEGFWVFKTIRKSFQFSQNV